MCNRVCASVSMCKSDPRVGRFGLVATSLAGQSTCSFNRRMTAMENAGPMAYRKAASMRRREPRRRQISVTSSWNSSKSSRPDCGGQKGWQEGGPRLWGTGFCLRPGGVSPPTQGCAEAPAGAGVRVFVQYCSYVHIKHITDICIYTSIHPYVRPSIYPCSYAYIDIHPSIHPST